jgi:hypothetical protein
MDLSLSLLSTSFPFLTLVHPPHPLLLPTIWYDWTADNIVLGSNLHYITEESMDFGGLS